MIRKGKNRKCISSTFSSVIDSAQQRFDDDTFNQKCDLLSSARLTISFPLISIIQKQKSHPKEEEKETKEFKDNNFQIEKSPRKTISRNKKRQFSPYKIQRSGEVCNMTKIILQGNIKNESKVMSWLEHHAPVDILPKILSFAGPQTVQSLSKVTRHWNKLACSESVFRTMCEEYGKWTEGIDLFPEFDYLDPDDNMTDTEEDHTVWKHYYDCNPIVPLDYPSLYAALTCKCDIEIWEDSEYFITDRNIRVLLEPVIHKLDRPIVLETEGDAEITFQTIQKRVRPWQSPSPPPSRPSTPSTLPKMIISQEDSASPPHSRRRLWLSCRSNSSLSTSNSSKYVREPDVPLDQAIISLKTKQNDVPVFQIRQGQMRLSSITLVHNARGTDIWNGQSAVQVQPRITRRESPLPLEEGNNPPTAFIEKCKITSVSGRGVVVIDGGGAVIRGSYIRDCAGTGIYVGSAGSHVLIEGSDVVQNGFGNQHRTKNAIQRGHSGIYIEQGVAIMRDCNVSNNCLTGISAVSANNAILTLTDSDVVANGTLQIELPEQGSRARRRSSLVSVSVDGEPRSRSGLSFSLQSDDDEPDHDSSSTMTEVRRESFTNSENVDLDGAGRRALFAHFGRQE